MEGSQMLKSIFAAGLAIALFSGCASYHSSVGSLRIDASSAATAEASFKAMMRGRDDFEKQRLALAVLAIGLEESKSVHDAMKNPDPSIATIRDKVAGMTADEIIERASKVTSVRFETPGN